MVYVPSRRFLIATDTLAAGHAPFMGFDIAMNMHEYLKGFYQLPAHDFDVLVPGHLTCLADRQDVQTTKDCALDVWGASQCRAALIHARWDD